MSAQVIEVVRTELLRRGEGVEGDPVRVVEQFWSKDGALLAENDRWASDGPPKLHVGDTVILHSERGRGGREIRSGRIEAISFMEEPDRG